MHQLPITPAVWADSRFEELAEKMQWGRAKTLGVLVLLWSATRDWSQGQVLTEHQVLAAVPCQRPLKEGVVAALLSAGYLQRSGSDWTVVDNARYFAVSAKMRDAGRKGGFRRHKKRQPAKLATVKAIAPASAAWDAYADAYAKRYNVTPKRNARVNGQMAQLVACLGAEDAAKLASWYVQHNSAFYIRAQHPVGALLKDYSGLHTQMQRGEMVTEHEVRAISDGRGLSAQMQRLAEIGG